MRTAGAEWGTGGAELDELGGASADPSTPLTSCVHEGDKNIFSGGRSGNRCTDDRHTRRRPVSSRTDAFTANDDVGTDGYPVIILYDVLSGILVLLLLNRRHRHRPV